jgi:hypothetical protein
MAAPETSSQGTAWAAVWTPSVTGVRVSITRREWLAGMGGMSAAAATTCAWWARLPPGGAQPWLRRAMRIDSSLQAFVAAGLYDSLNGCADNAYVVSHVSPKYGGRYTLRCYAGGHMMYDVATERRKLQRDVAAFVAATSGSAP